MDTTPQLVTDQSAEEQFVDAATKATAADRGHVLVRLVGQLYQADRQAYANWRGVLWRLRVPTSPEQGADLLQALQLCVRAITTVGPKQVTHLLQTELQTALPLSDVGTDDLEDGR